MATTKPTTMMMPRVAVIAFSASFSVIRPVSWPVAAGLWYIDSSWSWPCWSKPVDHCVLWAGAVCAD